MLKKMLICVMVLSLLSLGGCAAVSKVLVGSCEFLSSYMPKVQASVANIQANYDVYVAVITGLIPATSETIEKARAWVAAADSALSILGAVINGACRMITESDVKIALATADNSLPKLALSQAELMSLKAKMVK